MMSKKIITILLFILFIADLSLAAVPIRKKNSEIKGTKISEDIRSEAGLNIKDWGIAIDAIYDARLDDLIPGYRIINIVLTNRSAEDINLSTNKDKWYILDNMGKKHTAYNHVKDFSEKIWDVLPGQMQDMLDYPHIVSPGKSTNIDLFFPKAIDLYHFREVQWRSAHFNKEFNVFTNYEKNLSVPNAKEFDTPTSGHIDAAQFTEEQDAAAELSAAKPGYNVPASNAPAPQIGDVLETDTNTSTTSKGTAVEGFVRIK